MREAMIFTNKNVESVLIPTAKLHVTLAVLTVPSGAETEKVPLIADIIKDASEKICKEPLKLRFRGLGTFSNGRVLFARCVAEEHFTTLDQLVRRVRRDIGQQLNVDVKGNPHDSYIPHITVAKIRPSQKEAFGSRLPLSMWADFQHQDFGDVTFDEIQLCNMKGKGKNDYYKVESSVKIQ
ncbi:hypothetical protein AGDE_05512 [Angomonas deanei]|nr:hypothetical protein AGDE_05512 [Angomonas deanei]|eukprot:EPY38417.1 hypothetical protein AGDE_05512 [Angomonas deanei]